MSKTPPTSVIRDGSLKASIWENEGKKGIYYTTTFAKTYEDRNGDIRDTSVFNNSDLLKVSELARQAYGKTNEMRQELLKSQQPEQSRDSAPSAESRAVRAEQYLKDQREQQSQSRDQDYDLDR